MALIDAKQLKNLPAASLTLLEVEVEVATTGRRSGSFTIAGAGMTVGKRVLIQQAVGPYTGKGTLADETEMDQLTVTGIVESATVIRCYWVSQMAVKGNFKFQYLVSN